jgi:hypothetical protein
MAPKTAAERVDIWQKKYVELNKLSGLSEIYDKKLWRKKFQLEVSSIINIAPLAVALCHCCFCTYFPRGKRSRPKERERERERRKEGSKEGTLYFARLELMPGLLLICCF